MPTISEQTKSKLWKLFKDTAIFHKASELHPTNNRLRKVYESALEEYNKLACSVAIKLPSNTNMLKLRDDFYAVEVKKGEDITMVVVAITEPGTYAMKRKNTNILGMEECAELLKEYGYPEAEAILQDHIEVEACNLIINGTYAEDEPEPMVEPDVPEDIIEMPSERPIIVSHHAGLRYVQRVLKISQEHLATQYKKTHYDEVNDLVIAGIQSAEQIWEADDGITYHLDANNVLYILDPTDNVIVTLYEINFGFAPHINRHVIMEQLQVIRAAKENAEEAADSHAKELLDNEFRVVDYDIRIRSLQSEIESLEAMKTRITSRENELSTLAKKAQHGYQAECRKLFKKYNFGSTKRS